MNKDKEIDILAKEIRIFSQVNNDPFGDGKEYIETEIKKKVLNFAKIREEKAVEQLQTELKELREGIDEIYCTTNIYENKHDSVRRIQHIISKLLTNKQ